METIYCPQCRESLDLPQDLLGESVKCPECAHVFVGKVAGGTVQESSKQQENKPPHSRRRRRLRNEFTVAQPSVKPHRGAAILTVGILSLVMCGILGPIVWTIGYSDLRQMKSGDMDPSGDGLTRAGMICGMVASGLWALGFCLYLQGVMPFR